MVITFERIVPIKRKPSRRYTRYCRKCGKMYQAESRFSRVCMDCYIANKSNSQARRRLRTGGKTCSGLTIKGNPCRNLVEENQSHCHVHGGY